MARLRLAQAAVAITLLAKQLSGMEPPRIGVHDALRQGQAAFLARAVRIELVEITEHEATARMDLEIERCYYGIDRGIRRLTMTYVSQSFRDTVLPVSYTVGQEILFVLATPNPSGRLYAFDSDLREKTDLAFVGSKLPRYHLDQEDTVLESVFTGRTEKVSYRTLAAWGRERATELKASSQR